MGITIPNPYLMRVTKKDTGKHGREAEKRLAKRIGGTLTPGSGALAGAKADVKKGEFLIESKATNKESMTLKREWLLKVYQEALETTKNPAVAISFTNDQGQSMRRDRWIMIPEHVWHEIVGD
jgi:hypothetical protein